MSDVDEVILARRTHKAFTGAPVSRAVIEELLALAERAPQHRMVNPWYFRVLDQAAIADLGAWIKATEAVINWPDATKGPRKVAKLTGHYFPQLGAMIHVTQQIDADAHIDLENHAAVCAAVQNILIGAAARGLASFWNSSNALRHPQTLERLGGDPASERFVASIWLGGRVAEPEAPDLPPLAERTSWFEGNLA